MFKMKSLVKSSVSGVRDGVQEITGGDMTEVEQVVASRGAAFAAIGGLSILASKFTFGALVAKGTLVLGTVMVVGGCGSAFVRGFVGGLKHELRKQDLTNQ